MALNACDLGLMLQNIGYNARSSTHDKEIWSPEHNQIIVLSMDIMATPLSRAEHSRRRRVFVLVADKECHCSHRHDKGASGQKDYPVGDSSTDGLLLSIHITPYL